MGSPADASTGASAPGPGLAPAEPAAAPSPAPEEGVAVPTGIPPAVPTDTAMSLEPLSPPAVPVNPEPTEAPSAGSVAEPPGVAATIAVPPLEEQASGEGGEWEMLVERFNTWWESGEVGRQWQRIRGPLKGVAIVVAVLLALRVYATVVSTIDAIPLISGLLELTGLIVVLHFSVTRLLRTSDRREVLSQWQRRWLDFRGRD